jgi:hypothetical protein
LSGVSRLFANHPFLKSGSLPPPELPSLTGRTTLSDSRRSTAKSGVEAATPIQTGLPRLPASPFHRAVPITPVDRTGACVSCFPVRAVFPAIRSGRHPHRNFRGLLSLHSRYGPLDRSAAQSGLCHEAPVRPIARPTARQLPDQSTTLWVESSSAGDAPSGRPVRLHVGRWHDLHVMPDCDQLPC